MFNDLHSHFYQGVTSNVFNHTHNYSGDSSKEPNYHGHIHYMSGYTTVDGKHVHYYSIVTGPDIPTENYHIHYFVGYTTTDNEHYHLMWGYTYINDSDKEVKKHFSLEEAKNIGDTLGIDWKKFDVEQFRVGLDVELEHGKVDPHTNVTNDDPILTGKIALAHLNEFPDYYTRLTQMEEQAEEFFEKKDKKNSKK